MQCTRRLIMSSVRCTVKGMRSTHTLFKGNQLAMGSMTTRRHIPFYCGEILMRQGRYVRPRCLHVQGRGNCQSVKRCINQYEYIRILDCITPGSSISYRMLHTSTTNSRENICIATEDKRSQAFTSMNIDQAEDLDKLTMLDMIDDLCVPIDGTDKQVGVSQTSGHGATFNSRHVLKDNIHINKEINKRSAEIDIENHKACSGGIPPPKVEPEVYKGGKKERRAIEGAIQFALKNQNLDRAAMLFTKANKKNLRLSTRTCKEAMRRFYQAQKHQEVLGVEPVLTREKLKCDTEMYLYLLEAHSRNSNWPQTIVFLGEMIALNVPRNDRIYLAVSKTCLAAKERQKMFTVLQRGIDDTAGLDAFVPKYLINKGAEMGELDVCDALYEYMVQAHHWRAWINLKHDGLLDLHSHTTAMAEAAVRRVLRLMLNRRYKRTRGPLWQLQTPEQQARAEAMSATQDASQGFSSSRTIEKYHPFDAFVVGQPRASSPPSQKSLRRAVQNYLVHAVSPPIRTYTPEEKAGYLAMDADDLAGWLARQ
ncbi:hypothetical protein SARC_07139 [Sphaeroforma arctica JP610]|uniref:Pentacotripeptide-repeat region of PRORP domain-containing protein n=1 Tax=Sphaeroforma arctica JP610 TaxID=667725 RepID=A0A0L0FUI8_9EUKA|nr:hypothetical protein SARC_07139 [Sphaeroforma arctica JP610]KNC80497.1 hypothetical protein SARC_07139 [Sphaeroforma arctica JP610]|eukprot:XP_014154399.1 hypothetical protein SARC_07139 [Sphaeroforma arctica JP610]